MPARQYRQKLSRSATLQTRFFSRRRSIQAIAKACGRRHNQYVCPCAHALVPSRPVEFAPPALLRRSLFGTGKSRAPNKCNRSTHSRR